MKFGKIFISGLIGVFLIVSLACQSTSNESANTGITPTPTEKKDDFAERLKAMQDADFDYIYAFRRKDGGEFDKEDKTFVKQNAPFGTNRWYLTSDEKVVIAGSNFKFTPKNLESLRNRFNLEDYSTKVDVGNSNVNTNVTNNNSKNASANKDSNKNVNKIKYKPK